MSSIAMTPMTRPAFAESRPLDRPSVAGRAAGKPRLRMTARGRAVLLTVLALPLALGIALGVLNGGGATATDETVAPLEFVTVQPGETLWGLASEIAPASDPRDVIADLVEFNRLPSSAVPAGIQLAVPPKYSN